MDSRRLGAGGREGGGGLFCLGGRAALLGTGGVVRWAGGGDSRTGVASERCAARRTDGTAPGRDAQRGSALFPAVRHRQGCHRLSEIAGRLGKPATSLTRPLVQLVDLGYVRRETPFGENEKSTRRTLYKICLLHISEP